MSIKIIDSDRGLKMSSCSLILIKTGLDQGKLSPNARIQPMQPEAHAQHGLMSFY